MKFLYIFYLVLFALLPTFILMKVCRKHPQKQLKLVILSIIIITLYFAISDPIGTVWKAWIYDSQRTLGVYITGGAIETILLGVITGVIFGLSIADFAQREEKKKPFWPLW